MESKHMIYKFKLPKRFEAAESLNTAELEEVMGENWRAIEQIEAEAIKRGCLRYRFVYEATDRGVAIYQIVNINRMLCKLQYCSLDGSQNTMVEQWGSETYVGTEYIRKHVKSWDMSLGLGDNIKVLDESSLENVEELAYQLGERFLYIQTCEDGYDYSIYNESFQLHDRGIYDDDKPNIQEVAQILLENMRNELTDMDDSMAEPVNPEKLAEAAENANAILHDGIEPVVLMRLIMGNAGDEVALRNICEAQLESMEELSDDEKEFLIETNSFYRSAEEFSYLHNAEPGEFERLVEDRVIVRTTDGYVWKDCV